MSCTRKLSIESLFLSKETSHRYPRATEANEMVNISFNDELPPASYPKEVLHMRHVYLNRNDEIETDTNYRPNSSVFRDAMQSLQLTSQDGPLSNTIPLPDARQDVISLLDLMWGTLNPSSRMPMLVPAERVSPLVNIADKYDVSALVHNVYTTLIFRVGFKTSASQFSSLLYAARYGDSWLFKQVLGHLTMEDPVQWTKEQAALLGYELYFCVMKAYPRGKTDAGTEKEWASASTNIAFPGQKLM